MGNPVTADDVPSLVSTGLDGDQERSTIVKLSNGDYVIAWVSHDADDDNQDIMLQRYHANGSVSGSAFRVNGYTDNTQTNPEVAATADGGYIVTWSSEGQDGSGSGIYFQVFDSDNQPLAETDFRANQSATYDQQYPAITVLTGGRFVITWESFATDGSSFGVYGRIFTAEGAPVIGEALVNGYTDGAQRQPSVTALNDGGYVVAWHGPGENSVGFDLWVQRYDSGGATVGDTTRVNTTTTADQFQASVAGLDDGGYVVVWTSQYQDGDAYGIYMKSFTSTGTVAVAETLVNTVTESYQQAADVAALDDGGWVVVWSSQAENDYHENTHRVAAQVYDSTGAAVGGEITVDTGDSVDADVYAEVAATATGFIVTWSGNAGDMNESSQIRQRSYSLADLANAAPALTGPQASLPTLTTDHAATVSAAQLLTGYSDADLDTLAVSGVTADHGAVHDNGNGTYAITPAAGYTGLQTLSYTVSDGHGHDVAATLTYSLADVVAGTATVVNATTGYHISPTLLRLSDGGHLVAWGGGTAYDSQDIRLQRYNADGTASGSATTINTYTTGSQTAPDIAATADGGYIVVWESGTRDGSTAGICYRRFDGHDQAVDSGEIEVNTTTAWDQLHPHVAVLDNGNYVITWMSPYQASSSWDCYSRLYDADGTALTGEVLVNSYTSENQDNPDVTAMSDGGYIITWTGYGATGSGPDIWFQRYDASGAAVGSNTHVNTTTYSYQYNPAIAELDDGGFVIAWYGRNSGNYDEIRMQRFDADGVAAGSETRVDTNSTSSDSPTAPRIAALDNGGWVVAWQLTNFGFGSGTFPVYAQAYDADGDAYGSLLQVSSGSGGTAALMATDTGFRIAWSVASGGNRDIYERTYTLADLDTGLTGTAGNDSLDGSGAERKMTGLAGDDTYTVDSAGDTVVEAAGQGTDLVLASISHTLAANVENLTLTGSAATGTGNALNNAIVGNASANTLSGGEGDDTLDGLAGGDSMTGGLGDDSYAVDDGADTVTEAEDEGTDTVFAVIDYTLGANVEALALQGTSALSGTGNGLANAISGNSAANALDGKGGADNLWGGDGNDSYYVDDIADAVHESADEGTDRVYVTAASYTLSDNVEYMTFTGTGDFTGTGNTTGAILAGGAGNDTLTGGSAYDVLSGGDGNDDLSGGASGDSLRGGNGNDLIDGGLGEDSMQGGAGDDTFVVDSANDGTEEGLNGGTDTVLTTVREYTLWDNVENLTYTGTDYLAGTGNGLANIITGSEGTDILNGGGGNDTLVGGAGHDSYFVDSLGDVITEAADGGTDFVFASVDGYTLAANVEYLILQGSGNLSGNGGIGANSLNGNAGNNALDGGAGADNLAGGDGDDSYYVDTAGDSITEYAGKGTDSVFATATSYTLSDNVENLTYTGSGNFSGTGNGSDNVLTGGTGNDSLSGGGGYDVLNGGDGHDSLSGGDNGDSLNGGAGQDLIDGGLGADSMAGGAGDDTYAVDNVNDGTVESPGGGGDLVRASVSAWTLWDNVENLTYTGGGNFAGTGNALANVIVGGAGNDVLDGKTGADTLSGGNGDDSYYVDNFADNVIEGGDAGIDTVFSARTSWTLGNNIENLVYRGSLAFTGTGNAFNNSISSGSGNDVLYGQDGDDLLNGQAGNDTMNGDAGDDIFVVDSALDVTTEGDGGGNDTVRTYVTYTLSDYVENLVLYGPGAMDGTGNGLDNVLTGNNWANALNGGDGNDSLNGGAGNDTMTGGAGNDTYVVDSLNDVVTETADNGSDTVKSSVTWTLGDNFENLSLSGTADLDGTGNALANKICGNAGDNHLAGGDGNDVLSGGSGNDTMTGGAGDDIFYVDNSDDVVTEADGGGYDTLRAGFTTTLGDYVERLQMQGSSDIDGMGNGLDNALTGNAGANHLSGLDGNDVIDGGLGDDTMTGGHGDDKYYVDSADDVVVELDNGGTDSVRATASYVLSDYIESLILNGSDNIDGTGNAQANSLKGNNANNVLHGGDGNDTICAGGGNDVLYGDGGDDSMSGGLGDDSYYIADAGDRAREADAAGTDTVLATISQTLGNFIENLVLLGTGDINGRGNGLGNTITGNDGDNRLTGGLGADLFVFNVHCGSDVVTDFSATDGDRLQIDNGGVDVTISQVGRDAVIDLGNGDTITVLNTSADAISFRAAIDYVT